MRLLAGFALFAMAPAAIAAEDTAQAETSYEEQIVQCMYEADPDLLYAMRDAEGPSDFMSAFAKGATICDADEDYDYSMKLFFDAVNDRIGPPIYEDDAGEGATAGNSSTNAS